ESRSPFQDLIGPPQLAVLLFQLLDPSRILRRGPRTHPLVDISLVHPATHRLHPIPQLVGYPPDRSVPLTRLGPQLADQAHRLILLLWGIATRRRRLLLFLHKSILVSKVRSLQETQGDSRRLLACSGPCPEQAPVARGASASSDVAGL